MISFINTNESTASASAADLTTVGPSITLARAGDYEIAWGAVAYNTVTPATQHMVLNTTGNPETVFTPPAANAFVSIGSGYRPINGIGAGSLVKAQYFTSTGTASFLYRYLNIRPVRVS
jgi:hypothetical protein